MVDFANMSRFLRAYTRREREGKKGGREGGRERGRREEEREREGGRKREGGHMDVCSTQPDGHHLQLVVVLYFTRHVSTTEQ